MQNADEASSSIIWVGQCVRLSVHGAFGPDVAYLSILTLPKHWYAILRLIVKMPKTFEPHGIFDQILHTSTFYLCSLTLFRHWYAQR